MQRRSFLAGLSGLFAAAAAPALLASPRPPKLELTLYTDSYKEALALQALVREVFTFYFDQDGVVTLPKGDYIADNVIIHGRDSLTIETSDEPTQAKLRKLMERQDAERAHTLRRSVRSNPTFQVNLAAGNIFISGDISLVGNVTAKTAYQPVKVARGRQPSKQRVAINRPIPHKQWW
jgi:hypothetical protein